MHVCVCITHSHAHAHQQAQWQPQTCATIGTRAYHALAWCRNDVRTHSSMCASASFARISLGWSREWENRNTRRCDKEMCVYINFGLRQRDVRLHHLWFECFSAWKAWGYAGMLLWLAMSILMSNLSCVASYICVHVNIISYTRVHSQASTHQRSCLIYSHVLVHI